MPGVDLTPREPDGKALAALARRDSIMKATLGSEAHLSATAGRKGGGVDHQLRPSGPASEGGRWPGSPVAQPRDRAGSRGASRCAGGAGDT